MIILGSEVVVPQFDEEKHLYTVFGRTVPSVSRILRPLTDAVYGTVDKKVLDEKAFLGSAVHKCIEIENKGGKIKASTMQEEWLPYLDAYHKFLKEMNVRVIESEMKLGCKRYCGTLDSESYVGDELFVIDYKTTSVIHPHVGVQLSAYNALINAIKPAKRSRAALQLLGNGNYVFHQFSNTTDDNCFNALLGIYYWSKQNEQ